MLWVMTLLLPSAGCQNVASDAAICEGSQALLASHAAALVADGGPQSLVTGQALIATLDAGCNMSDLGVTP